jgi:hypothetical protein
MVAKRGRGDGTGKLAAEVPDSPPAIVPPQPSRWQLVTSSILVGLWIIFLAWMAFTG